MRFKKIIAVSLAFVCALSATVLPHISYAEPALRFEFEDGDHPNSKVKEDKEASGGKYVFLEQNNESISVNVEAPETGMYDIIICYSAPYGEKIQNLVINGVDQGQISLTSKDWTETKVLTAKLEKGDNDVTIKGSWGWTNFDYVRYEQSVLPDITGHDRTPCDPESTDSAKRLMAYLADVYGSNIISGQQEIYKYGPHDFEYEFDYIKDKTGKTPAIRGFDYLNCNPLYGSDDGTTERIIDWVNTKGGIATASWHITVPKQFESYVLKETKVDWSNATYEPKSTDFDTSKAVVEGTKENEYYMWCLELLAAEIKKLQDADVPLIFRPLHEAEGGGGETGSWFWWGKSGSKVYKELWLLTYKTLTETYGLHNLIWEWNSYAYETSADWYPGDEYVDIIAYDKYNCTDWSTGSPVLGHNDSAISGTFYSIVEKYKSKKMVAMAENDSIPTLKNLLDEKAAWLYFCPWYDGGSDDNNFLSNPVFNRVEDLKEIYQSDYCITIDELPDLKKYESGDIAPTKPTETTEPEETTTTVLTTTEPKPVGDYAVTISGDKDTPMQVGEEREFTVSGPKGEKVTHVNIIGGNDTVKIDYTDGTDTFTVTALEEGEAILSVSAAVPGYSILPIQMLLTIKEALPVPDYAGVVEMDKSPIKVGEKRAVRVYNPVTGKTKGLDIKIVENDIYSIEYTEGSDTFYIIGLSPGSASISVWETSCPFVSYIDITVVEDTAKVTTTKKPVTTKATTTTKKPVTTKATTTTTKTKPETTTKPTTTTEKPETTKKITTIVGGDDYIVMLTYDKSPMKVGEVREIQVYNPYTKKNGDILSPEPGTYDIYTLDYDEKTGTLYVTAVEPGKISFGVKGIGCAFTGYVELTVEDAEQRETTVNTTVSGDKGTTTTTTKPVTTKTTTTTRKPKPTAATNVYEVPSNVKATRYGDVNGDGNIDIADLVTLNMFLLNREEYPLTDVQIANADCAKNGVIDTTDSSILMNYIVMFINESELGQPS